MSQLRVQAIFDDDHVEIRAGGILDEALVQQMRQVMVDGLKLQSWPKLLVDLTEITEFDHEGRTALIRLHEELQGQIQRCAYVADRPRLRSMVLMVIYHTQDENMRPVPNRESAITWLDTPSPGTADGVSRVKQFLSKQQAS